MVTVSIQLPDTAVKPIATLIRARYPDLMGEDLEVGRTGVARLIREMLRMAESNRIEVSLQAAVESQRNARLAALDALLSQIE